jgi:hypothetical protein
MRGHRPFTYAILVINALFLIWLVAGVWTTPSHVPFDCSMAGVAEHWADCSGSPRTQVTVPIIFLWGLADLILGVVWLATNRAYKAKKDAEAVPCGSFGAVATGR